MNLDGLAGSGGIFFMTAPLDQRPRHFAHSLCLMMATKLEEYFNGQELEEKIQSVFGYHPLNCPSFLVLEAWKILKNHGLFDKEAISQALLSGKYPEYFKSLLDRCEDPGIIQLRIMYDDVFWDDEVLDYCQGVGNRVVLTGLTSAKGQTLNGQTGIIVGQEGERFIVQLEKEVIKLKDQNLCIKFE